MSTSVSISSHVIPADAGRFPWLRTDFLSSVVVFLVALPLCMGIAIASGAPPAAGLITGIIGGLVVGSISGSPLQVSGPAAGLAVVVFEIVQKQGLAALGAILLLAGVIQVLAGLLKLGQWFRAVSPAVIHGMLAGIGVLIFASQFHVMLDDSTKSSGLKNIAAIPAAIYKALLPADGSNHHKAAAIGILTIAVIVAFKSLAPKKLQLLPATLLAVIAGTLASSLMGLPIKQVNVPDSITSAIRLPTPGALSTLLTTSGLVAALGMAFVASAETLLCATAVDKMHNGPRTRYDRELAAQGVGNILCGALGGLPMTGVIVRSAANVDAGAKTRASAILHGLWLLVFVAAFPSLLRMIPMASLAALLVYTGYKLVNPKVLKDLRQYGKGEIVIYFATLLTIVATDLLTGVLLGIALSALKLLYTFSHLRIDTAPDPAHNTTTLHLRGAATFVRLPKLAATLDTVPPSTELHVRFEDLKVIDHACLDLLMNWEKQHTTTGGRLVLDWDRLTARFQRPAMLPEAANHTPPRINRHLQPAH